MDILKLSLDQIDAGDRLRGIDDDQARLIGASMADWGQKTPIEVRAVEGSDRPYRLVAGGHRYRGAELMGIPTILAVVFVGTDLQAQLWEIDENLIRHELTALDRAAFLARRQEIYQRLYPETRKGGARVKGSTTGGEQTANLALCFTADAAERLRFSARSIQRAIALHNALSPSVRVRLVGTALADNASELEALAKLPADEQLKVAGLLVEPQNKRPANVAAAVRMVRGEPEPAHEDAVYAALMTAWRKAPTTDRDRFVEFLVAQKVVNRIKGARS